MADRIQNRRDTAANWALYNPVLLDGEIGVEKDTDQWKMGDGVHTWSQLPYRGGELVQQKGQSTTVGMSQKAVTDLVGLYEKDDYSFSDTSSTDIHSSYLKSGNTISILPSDIILDGNHLGSVGCYASKNSQWTFLGNVYVGKVNIFDLEDDYDFVRVGSGDTYGLSEGSYKIYKTDSIQGFIGELEEKEENDVSLINAHLSNLDTFVNETGLDLDYVFYGHNNDKPTFSYEDAKKIVRGLCVLSIKYFGTNTNYWTLAQVTVTSTEIGFIIYEKLTNDNWNRSLSFWVKKSVILSLDEGFYKIYGSPLNSLNYLIVDIRELKKKVNSETVFDIDDLQYKIRPCYFADGFYKNEASLNMPIGMDRRTVFKNKNYFNSIFREAFLDVRYNGEYDPTKGYGFVYIAIRQNDLYFENYCWDLETGAWSSTGDNFSIPDSIATQDKIQYYKSPNGKYEILANFSKLYKDAPDQIPSGDYVLIGAQKFLEFEDRVFAFRESPHLIDIYLLNQKNLIYSLEDGRQSAGYPDSQMISDEQLAIHDIVDGRTSFITFSMIQWCQVTYGGIISDVTLDAPYHLGRTRCVIKIFDSLSQFDDALNDSIGTKIFDRVLTESDYIDSSKKVAIVDVSEQFVAIGKYIAAIYIDKDAEQGSTVAMSDIEYGSGYTPIVGGTPFRWKGSYDQQSYVASSILEDYAYYQLPLRFNSKFPLDKKVKEIEKRVLDVENFIGGIDVDPRIVLPSHLYAIVGKEFNLYYDAFTLLPDIGTPQPDLLFDIQCSIGATNSRSFRVTPTSGQVGNYNLTVNIYNNKGKILSSKSTILTVVAANNPSTQKRILCIGDSTTDDTAAVIFGLRSNLDDLAGGVSPILVGHKPYYNNPDINHGASTGKTFGFFANGMTVLKFNFTGLPDNLGVYPNLTFSLPDNTGYIVNIETHVANDGSGKGYSIANIWIPGSSSIGAGFTGTLKTNGAAGFPSTVTVESTEQLNNWSPFRFNGVLDFSAYASHIGLENNELIDLFSIDLGINDSRGVVHSESTIVGIINNAKALAEAFHTYNPNGIVMFCLPKSCANPRSLNSAQHDTYRMNIHTLRERLIETFDENSDYSYCCVCNSGLSIDRWFGYPISTVKAAARYNEDIQINGDDVHPRTEGYNQVADAMIGCIIHHLNS